MKLVKCIPEFYFFTLFLKNRNISSKIKRSKVTDYEALREHLLCDISGERSGSVVECLTLRLRGRGFEPHQGHCIVVLEQDTFILA